MDFTLTEDQELLRDTAAKLLDRECPPALVPRAHRRPVRVRTAVAPPAASTPRSAPGPATDLCLFLEQTGLRRRARSVPRDRAVHVAHRRRRRRHRHRRARRRSRRTRSCSKPTASSASRSSVPGPRSRSSTPPTSTTLRFVADRRLLPPRLQLDTDELDARPAAARPDAYAAWRDRAHVSLAAEMVGTAAAHLRHGARVRQGAQPVRRADRLVPGDPAQARRHVARARARDRGRAVRGDDRRRRRRRPRRGVPRRPRPRPARPRAASSRTAPRSTAASATRGSTTCTCTSGARPPTSTCSARRLAPRPPRRPPHRLTDSTDLLD